VKIEFYEYQSTDFHSISLQSYLQRDLDQYNASQADFELTNPTYEPLTMASLDWLPTKLYGNAVRRRYWKLVKSSSVALSPFQSVSYAISGRLGRIPTATVIQNANDVAPSMAYGSTTINVDEFFSPSTKQLLVRIVGGELVADALAANNLGTASVKVAVTRTYEHEYRRLPNMRTYLKKPLVLPRDVIQSANVRQWDENNQTFAAPIDLDT
jgi:hypothetical protein